MLNDPYELVRFTYFRGRVALSAILRALGVGRGDDVVIQAFTCLAVPEAVMSVGANPVYADVEPEGITMDADDLAQRLSARTRAIVVQHTYGLPSNMDRILAVATQHGIPVIEDCAHALGSRWRGREVGGWGIAGFHSFEASKPIVIGMGGAAITRDPELARALCREYASFVNPGIVVQGQLLAMFAAHAAVYRPQTYWLVRRLFRAVAATGIIKGNYNEVSADAEPSVDFERRMGRSQRLLLRRALRTAESSLARRKAIGLMLRERVTNPGARHVVIPQEADPVFTRVPFIVDGKTDLLARAPAARVELADFYDTPVHPLRGDALRSVGYEPGSCPNAEWVSSRIVSLPTNRFMVGATAERAIAFLNRCA